MLTKIIGSIFLISGTSIGAGMLGLPIKTLGINFKIILAIFIISWIIMTISAISMLEISMWVKGNSNIVSIAEKIISIKFGKTISIIYVLFLYSLITAYISGGTSILTDLLNINNNISIIIFIVPFAITLFFGISFVDQINKILFTFLIISYLLLIIKIPKEINTQINNYNFLNNTFIIFSLPIIITSFGYNLLIPSLKTYLIINKKIIIKVIILGSLIPLCVYITWEYLMYSFFIKLSNNLFIKTLFGNGNETEKIIMLLSETKTVLYCISIFSFFALTSSLLGVALGIYDFFFDLLKFDKNSNINKIIIIKLVFITPLILNTIYPYTFMIALSYAGIFASILLIIFPIYTLWYGRYIKKIKYKYIILNNKIILSTILYIAILIILIDTTKNFISN